MITLIHYTIPKLQNQYLNDNRIFQHDRASIHRGKIVNSLRLKQSFKNIAEDLETLISLRGWLKKNERHYLQVIIDVLLKVR
ncbi:6774_t:CDS:2 [Dentiscutata erythropus]|uniref:6774_t:CDS:1 n=1 Tax=Dentiscutata erythropus TaxID=1348616 RepID=A0A9N9DRB1_9GLOM|nr:6774_t:CDS:2 [Dentiscutata erythropus]